MEGLGEEESDRGRGDVGIAVGPYLGGADAAGLDLQADQGNLFFCFLLGDRVHLYGWSEKRGLRRHAMNRPIGHRTFAL